MSLELTHHVLTTTNQNINKCLQCLKCSSGCPVSSWMDYKPNQINRMLQLGYKEKILNSSVIWLCVGCQMCVTRCPMQLNIPKIMDILRELALKERVHIKERNISLFHQQFLNSIKRWGRVYELELIVLYKLKSNTLFQDIELGKKMFSKGKLNLLPDIAGTSDVKKIFNRSIGR